MVVGITADRSGKPEQIRSRINRYQSSEPCIYCGEVILTRSGVISIRGKSCHPQCIRCSKCGHQVELKDSMVVVVEDEIVITCDDCRTNRCQVCSELCDDQSKLCDACEVCSALTEAEKHSGSRYTNNGITYHFECLKCHNCKKMFTKDMQILHKSGVNFHVDCSTPTKKKSSTPYLDLHYIKEKYTDMSDLGLFQREFLKKHNELRARHGAPPLGWSEKLTARARRWAIHLTVINKDYPATNITIHTQKGLGYGQSNSCVLGKGRGLDQLAVHCCEDWYKTGQRYSYSDTQLPPECATFTQLLWNDCRAIGACITWYGEVGFIVANYWPPGNREGEHHDNVRPEGAQQNQNHSVVKTVLNGSHLEQEKSPKPVSDNLIKEIEGQVKKKKDVPEPSVRQRLSSGDVPHLSELKPRPSTHTGDNPRLSLGEKPTQEKPPVSERPELVKKAKSVPSAKPTSVAGRVEPEKVTVGGPRGMKVADEVELVRKTDQTKAIRKTSTEEPIKPRHPVSVSVEQDTVEYSYCSLGGSRRLSGAKLGEEKLMRRGDESPEPPEDLPEDENDEEMELEEEDLSKEFLKRWDKKKKMNLKVVPYYPGAKEIRVLKARKKKKLIGEGCPEDMM